MARVNVGAGTITCNYASIAISAPDRRRAFIGSGSMLVAPGQVSPARRSVPTDHHPRRAAEQLTLERAPQV
jgi:bifunctional N-acetylglucosamine-1-phosphate-uridyltransferase/glucosamine-1-phosphate-acetyltransferase GlmU-like protein